jgi:hypothetical protein
MYSEYKKAGAADAAPYPYRANFSSSLVATLAVISSVRGVTETNRFRIKV